MRFATDNMSNDRPVDPQANGQHPAGEAGEPIVPTPEMLATALCTEARHLATLCGILEGQRQSVARDDTQAVEDSVYDIHRVLVTVAEAKRHREGVLRCMAGDRTIRLLELERNLGPNASEALLVARDELIATAERLARELKVNRLVLRGALAAADAEVRALVSGTEASPGYAPGAGSEGQDGSGRIVNRRV